MKHIRLIYLLIASVCAMAAPRVIAQQSTPYFPLPEIPESIDNFSDRIDYLVDHYWDRLNWKNAFSSKAGMEQAFITYLQWLPQTSPGKASKSIDELLKNLKKHPEGLLQLTSVAEGKFHSDSALYVSDDIFLKFLDAAIGSKKIDKATKTRYQELRSRINASRIGGRPAPVAMTMRDGSRSDLVKYLDSTPSSATIVYFFDPSAPSTVLDRLKLDTDSRLNAMLSSGDVKMLAIYPGETSPQWLEDVKRFPAKWNVAASPEASSKIDILTVPSFYVLDREGKITYKNISLDELLALLGTL